MGRYNGLNYSQLLPITALHPGTRGTALCHSSAWLMASSLSLKIKVPST